MILSRLLLNPRSRTVILDRADVHSLHRRVMAGFPKSLPEGERVLFRLDESQHDGCLNLLVQSLHAQPDWAALPTGYLLQSDPFAPLPNPAIKRVDLTFRADQWLHFRLRANPTVKKRLEQRPPDGKGQGKRVAIIREEAQLAWLGRKAEAGGFHFRSGDVRVAEPGREFGLTREDPRVGRRHRLELHIVQFDGLLQVTDPERFAATLQRGIGSAKGFGCGLLSLAAP